MAFFSSNKKTNTTSKVVRPTVIRTQNVSRELVDIAKSYGVTVDKLDFNLLEVQTYTRISEDKKETEWEEVSAGGLHELDDETALLNPHFQIKQTYEVEIYSKNPQEDKYKDFKLAVGANATKCKVYLSIQSGSHVQYNPRFERELLVLINNKKIRAGILINIFDTVLDSAISKLSASVRIQEEITYDKNETILIAEGYEPTLTTNDKIIFHYDKKEKLSEKDKIDYAARGFIQSVSEEELLIEYIKPKKGKPGRNCRGEFISAEEPTSDNFPNFTIDDTIKMVDTKETIKYIALVNGYMSLDKNEYSIKKDLDIGEISFKTTGSISSGLESDVAISVKEADAVKDAIGTGMDVEVSEITIEGNVGPNASVNAMKAIVEGQTHKSSVMKAENLKINVHKGKAYGNNINITRLEHGIVEGDNVDISQAIGGNIRGREVMIGLCGSYVNVTASKLIEIKKLQGKENEFIIDPLLKRDTKDNLDKNKDEIKKVTNEVKNFKNEIEEYTKKIKEDTQSFNDIKKKLIHYKKNGIKMPDAFVKQYKQFKKMQERLVLTRKEYDSKYDHLKLLTTRTASFQDNIFDARIINRDRWIGYNQLKFRLVDPPIELVYKPEEGSSDKIFAIVEVDDGEFEIQAVKG